MKNDCKGAPQQKVSRTDPLSISKLSVPTVLKMGNLKFLKKPQNP